MSADGAEEGREGSWRTLQIRRSKPRASLASQTILDNGDIGHERQLPKRPEL